MSLMASREAMGEAAFVAAALAGKNAPLEESLADALGWLQAGGGEPQSTTRVAAE
jgi:hypothetical protein